MNTLFVLLALLATGGWVTSTLTLRTQRLERATERLERRLDLLLKHLGIEEPEPEGLDEVRALVREGRTIPAIKAYRRITGASLVDAKEAVDALSAEH